MTTTDYKFATNEDMKTLRDARREADRWGGYSSRHHYTHQAVLAGDHPFGTEADLNKTLGLPEADLEVRAYHVSAKEYTCFYDHNGWLPDYSGYSYTLKKSNAHQLRSLPLFVLVRYTHANRYKADKCPPIKATDALTALAATAKNPYFLGIVDQNVYHHSHMTDTTDANVAVTVTLGGHEVVVLMPFNVAEKAFGLEITTDMKLRLKASGSECPFTGAKDMIKNLEYYDRSYRNMRKGFDFTFPSVAAIESKIGMSRRNLNNLLRAVVKNGAAMGPPDKMSGIKKTYDRLAPLVLEMVEDSPALVCAYRTFAANSGRAIDGVKISAVFNDVFEKVTTKEDLVKALKVFYTGKDDGDVWGAGDKLDEGVKRLDVYKVKRKAVLKSQTGRAFAKIQEEAENLTIDKKKYKLTWAKIESGELPLGTFFRKSEQYFLLNDNWDLWEEMFKRGYGEQAIELANEVKGRTTYEKDLMSYLYFVLYGLPEYLKKQTGHKWTCTPKLVTSQAELDPPKEGDNGIARQRSALTPIVDNDAHTVEVPYASLAIYGGRGTTYCYSHDYHVLTRGFSFNGYAITSDIEKGLNGRDDYGLMFYTLTGSAQGRGYPTFLIIFERRSQKGDTKVHFHRTHPFRSKEGDYNPIHNWIKGCYNWMAGNVNRENIKAQQGDLFFVKVVETAAELKEADGGMKIVKDLDFSHEVRQYDKHTFEVPVKFAEYTKAAKSNVLGYVQLDTDVWLRHTEHDDVKIPPGTYAIHQCRSWEANPKGVWSLRID